MVRSAEEKWKTLLEIIAASNAQEAFINIRKMMSDASMPGRFSEAGIDVDLDELLGSVNEERFANNPAPFDRKRLKELIEQYIV
jgi:alcohol dehydrogenase class IV